MALNKEEKKDIVKNFGKNPKDSGSAEVQVAFLTKNINYLTDHCKKNPKDFSSRRGLLKMVCQRRTFLRYIKQKDAEKYSGLIKKLELRK
ncbi:MAG: 30S ribosomal protein S15 [Candidatus Babeliales bacterium]|jgi:small subunit ribosomal protein S15